MMLTKIDDLIRPDHGYLTSNDQCYFLGEYTARKGYSQSATNQLIFNFKKGMDRRVKLEEWKYKQQAIETVSRMFYETLDPQLLIAATLVPIPPSKAKSDPMYDDRLLQMLQGIDITSNLDIRELIIQTQSTQAAHELENRPRPEEIEKLYTIDTNLVQPIPSEIWIFDDVLTAGTHYRAASSILVKTFPGVPISGYFVARRVPEDSV
jgi:predicted amidophosphoribosyltransferase